MIFAALFLCVCCIYFDVTELHQIAATVLIKRSQQPPTDYIRQVPFSTCEEVVGTLQHGSSRLLIASIGQRLERFLNDLLECVFRCKVVLATDDEQSRKILPLCGLAHVVVVMEH